MPISPATKVNEYQPTEEQILAEIPGGSQWISHSELLRRLARHAYETRGIVSNATVYYHLGQLRDKKGYIDESRRPNNAHQPKMETHYRRRAVR